MPLTLTSPAFERGQAIPRRYTCEGDDISPPLEWAGTPAGTKSLALLVEDPDAPNPANPKRVWVHWLVYDIPAGVTGLPEGAGGKDLPEGCHEGLNDWKKPGYGGPSPPVGRHRYFHRLYALDCGLGDRPCLPASHARTLEKRVIGYYPITGRFPKAPPTVGR